MSTATQSNGTEIEFNGEAIDVSRYFSFHRQRFNRALETLRALGGGRVLELGGHPWAMTSLIAEEPACELVATVSAEEITKWPDDIGVTNSQNTLRTTHGKLVEFTNYSVNVERRLFDIDSKVDVVLACEIIEHLIRSPHIMLLNINRWLNMGGKTLITTPNGMQFSNPLRRKNSRPAFRCYCYERHNGLFTLAQLEDLTEKSGFRVTQSGYWNDYQRRGLSRLYDLPLKLPIKYMQQKFSRTIFVIAEKISDQDSLTGMPIAYAPNADWEHIAS